MEILEQVLVTVFVLRLFNMERIRTINVGLPTYVDLHKVRDGSAGMCGKGKPVLRPRWRYDAAHAGTQVAFLQQQADYFMAFNGFAIIFQAHMFARTAWAVPIAIESGAHALALFGVDGRSRASGACRGTPCGMLYVGHAMWHGVCCRVPA